MPHHKFCKSLTQTFSCGMRFKIRFETEDSSERRLVSLILSFSFLYHVRRTNITFAGAAASLLASVMWILQDGLVQSGSAYWLVSGSFRLNTILFYFRKLD